MAVKLQKAPFWIWICQMDCFYGTFMGFLVLFRSLTALGYYKRLKKTTTTTVYRFEATWEWVIPGLSFLCELLLLTRFVQTGLVLHGHFYVMSNLFCSQWNGAHLWKFPSCSRTPCQKMWLPFHTSLNIQTVSVWTVIASWHSSSP